MGGEPDEIARIAKDVASGNLDIAFDEHRKTGILAALADVEQISRGDMPDKISETYKGDFNEIKNNLNMLIDATNVVTQIAQNIAAGNVLVRVERRPGEMHYSRCERLSDQTDGY